MVRILIKADSRYPVNRRVIRKAISDTLQKNKVTSPVEVSVAVVGTRKMRALSNKYLGGGEVHDVLSFCLEEISGGGGLPAGRQGFVNQPSELLRLGDVVLCWSEVLLSANRDNVLVDDEVYRLTVHAVEHLLGKHHE